MSTDILFDGFEKLMPTLRKLAPQLRYIVVDEVLHRKRTQPVARVNFSPIDLAPYVAEPAPAHEDDDEDVSDEPSEGSDEGDEDEGDELGDLAEASAPEPASELDPLCEASARWMRHVAREIMATRAACTFKVWFYTLKGEYLGCARFVAENGSYRPPQITPPGGPATPPIPTTPAPQLPVLATPQFPPQAAPAPAPAPVFEVTQRGPSVALALGSDGRGQLVYLDPETIPEARVWRALGRATEEFLGTVGRAFNGIVDLQARTVTHQAEQLDKSQALVQNLAGQLLAARHVWEADEAEQKEDERQLRVREELGKTFLSELGSLGRVLASSKLGAPPELLELGDLVATSPELAEAIRDPNVRAMLKDEKTRKELAQLLLLASKKADGAPGSAA